MKFLKSSLFTLCLSAVVLSLVGCSSTSSVSTSSLSSHQESSLTQSKATSDSESSLVESLNELSLASSEPSIESSLEPSVEEIFIESSAISEIEDSKSESILPEISKIEREFNFILNTSTKKLHTRECSAAKRIKSENRKEIKITAETLEKAISELYSMGYSEYELCEKC